MAGSGVGSARWSPSLWSSPVVGGVALLPAYGRFGLVGQPLDAATGLRLPFTPYAVVLAQLFVSLPFFVLAVEGCVPGARPRLLSVAGTLGASPPASSCASPCR